MYHEGNNRDMPKRSMSWNGPPTPWYHRSSKRILKRSQDKTRSRYMAPYRAIPIQNPSTRTIYTLMKSYRQISARYSHVPYPQLYANQWCDDRTNYATALITVPSTPLVHPVPIPFLGARQRNVLFTWVRRTSLKMSLPARSSCSARREKNR